MSSVYWNIAFERDHTINLSIHKNGPVTEDDIMCAIRDYDNAIFDKTRCLEQVSRNRFRWSLDDKELVDIICDKALTVHESRRI